jgi:hypothetical protein
MDELTRLLNSLLLRDNRARWVGVRFDRDGKWNVVTTFKGRLLTVPETEADDPLMAVTLAIERFDNRTRDEPYLFGGPWPDSNRRRRPATFERPETFDGPH